jgi:acetoin utilization protein AcuB
MHRAWGKTAGFYKQPIIFRSKEEPMLLKNWMTREIITVTPETSMMKASKILKDQNIHRLPVVEENGKLVGIVSDRDIKDASPSKATTLDVHELYYLLSEIKIKDIMTRNPHTINEEATV